MKKPGLLLLLIAGIVGFDAFIAAEYIRSRENASVDSPTADLFDEYEFMDGNALDEGTLSYDAELAKGTSNHKPLRLIYDVRGLDSPRLLENTEIQLSDSTPVIGVQVGDQTCAFVINAMDQPSRHIVNVIMDRTPISVTYCPLVDCVRVVRSTGDQVIPLRLGGLNEEDEMVLMLNGTRYDQESLNLPLTDHPHERLTLKAWKQRHPGTKVFSEESTRILRSPLDATRS